MIKVYDKNNNFIRQIDRYKNMKIEKEINKLDLFFFNIPKQAGEIFEEEGYIETKNNGKFIIKEKNLSNDGYEIVARYDLEDLNDWIESKAYVTATPKEMLDNLLQGKDWTVVSSITTKRTVTATNVSMIALIKQIVDTFNAEVMFNNVTKIIYIEEELGSDKGVYFHNELNLRRLNISSDTYDFATRMIPRGINGEGIEAINNGVPYVENHTYSDKIVTVIWEDERYTVMDNLKEDAEKKLEVLSKPRRAFTADIVNLAKASQEYSILDYGIGDTITLIDSNLKEMVKHNELLDTWEDLENYTWGELSSREWGDLSYSFDRIKEKQRIMKLVHYPDNPLKDTIDIENRPRMLGEKESERIENLEGSNSVIKASLELLEDSIVSTVKRLENLVVNADNRLYQSQTSIPFYFNVGDGEVVINRSAFHPYYKATSDENVDLSINFPLSRYAENLIGQEVTISLDVMTEMDSMVTIEGKEYDTKANEWIRIHFTKDFPDTDTRHIRVRNRYSKKQSRDIRLGNNLIDSLTADIDTLYYRNLQVQKGDIPTNWTLTPEELDAQIEKYESEIKQLADEISLRVTAGELESIVTQNAESWELSIHGQLKGKSYRFDGQNFTIGGSSGDVVEHDNTSSKYYHQDGSYTDISALGLLRYDAGIGREYHHMTKVIKFSTGGDGQAPAVRWIPLGPEFNDKEWSVALSISDSMQATSIEATLHRIVLTQGHDSNNNVLEPRFREGQWEYPVTGYTTYYNHKTDSRRYSDLAGIMIITA